MKYHCKECNSDFEDVLEKIEFELAGDVIRIKNSEENPCCQDCLQNAFFKVLDGIVGP